MQMKTDKPYAVFLDVDGTLAGNTLRFSPRNVNAITKARAAGHFVFVNTGRALGNIPEELFDAMKVCDGFIAGSGTYLECNGKTFSDVCLDRSLLRELCEYLLPRKDLWAVFECKKSILGVNSVPEEWGVKKFIGSPDDLDTVYADENVEVTAVGKTPPDDFIERFGERMRIIVMRDFADCIPNGCSKANGMKKVLNALNIPVERSIAMGDSENDLDMLSAAGISVAVANAAPKVLEAADMVTDSNLNDGVAKALEKLLGL